MFNGKRLKRLRKEAGLIQADVAAKLNIRRETYTRYELDEITPPADMIAALAKLFEVSTDYLLSNTDDPTSPNKKTPLNKIYDWGDFSISARGEFTEEDKELIVDSVNFAMDQRRKRHEAKLKEQKDK